MEKLKSVSAQCKVAVATNLYHHSTNAAHTHPQSNVAWKADLTRTCTAAQQQRAGRTVKGERRTVNEAKRRKLEGCAQVAQVRSQLCCRSQAHGNTCWTHVPRLGSSLESEVGSRWRLMTARNFRLNQRSTHCGSDEVKTDTKDVHSKSVGAWFGMAMRSDLMTAKKVDGCVTKKM
jgi:hypothetical protein